LDEKCLRFLDKRKQAKMQWLQDPNQTHVYNLRREASRHFRNKNEEHLKAKIREFETKSKLKEQTTWKSQAYMG
jgi:actin-related protein